MDFQALKETTLKSSTTYYINKGIYKDEKIKINVKGNNGLITIEGGNNVVLEGDTSIEINGDNVMIRGFNFNNVRGDEIVKIKGNYNHFVNNEVSNFHNNIKNFISIDGNYNRIIKNTFTDIKKKSNLILIKNKKNLIGNNTFNKLECDSMMVIGDKKKKCGWNIIYNNFISHSNLKKGSIILINDDNKVLYNKISICKNNAVVIKGNNNTIQYNFITGDLTSGDFGGFVVFGNHTTINDNTFDTLITLHYNLSPISVYSNTNNIVIERNDFIENYYPIAFNVKLKKKNNKNIQDFTLRYNRLSKCRGFFLNDDKLLKTDFSRGIIENNEILKRDIKLNIHTAPKLDKINIKDFFNNHFQLKEINITKNEEIKEMVIKDDDDFIIEDIKEDTPKKSNEIIGLEKFYTILDRMKLFKDKLYLFKELEEDRVKMIDEMLDLLN